MGLVAALVKAVVESKFPVLLSTVLMHSFEVLVLFLSISVLWYSMLLLNHISEGNIVLPTPLHLFDSFSYYLLSRSTFYKNDNITSF